MSRAFVKEDAGDDRPPRHHHLPPRDDPGYDAAAAAELLEGARVSEIIEAEEATGYPWGDPTLFPHVARILERARADGDDRLEQVAERFLRHGTTASP